MKKISLPLLLIVILGVSAYYALKTYTPSPFQGDAAVSQLEADILTTQPHFIKKDIALSPELQKIKDDVIRFLTAQEPADMDYRSQLILAAIGKRYVLISQPSGGSSHDEIIDSRTGKISYIPNGANYVPFYPSSEEAKEGVALYIGDKDMYTYSLDQPSFLLIPKSKLSGTETYNSGKYDSPTPSLEETRTGSSVTISIFDSSKLVPNKETGTTMYKKVRDITIPLL